MKYKKEQIHIKWFSQDQINAIVESLPTLRDKIIFEINIETGMRIGEILGLKLKHFEPNEGILSIKKEENIENEALAKTNERELPISGELSERIELYIRGERLDSLTDNVDYIFLNWKGSAKGGPLKPTNYLRIIKRAAERGGFDQSEIRTHSGISTLAQQLVDALNDRKVTEAFILEQFGWGSMDTLKRYVTTFNRKGRHKVYKKLNIRRFQDKSKG
ncbi:tyrosine-type recombinase/integrase [Alkalihalobacillus deserti]|uniref:tyrosine-type recombinase/integrase n=1 Tax=Alkalihalobacillus deserti TaxID=2879466 RepID=UPI001D151F4F|nr:site-specific integrase [Alkalihalobacillus deserti]